MLSNSSPSFYRSFKGFFWTCADHFQRNVGLLFFFFNQLIIPFKLFNHENSLNSVAKLILYLHITDSFA